MHRMHRLYLGVVGVIFAVAAPGCTLPKWGSSLPEPRPLGSGYMGYAPTESSTPALGSVDRVASPEAEPTGELSLRKAVEAALLRSPELASFAWSVRQAEAEQVQASLVPNPEVEAEFENFGGSRNFTGDDSLETTITLSQLIELGGKRAKRMALAAMDSKLAGWDYEAMRIEVLTGVANRFIDVLVVQRKLGLAKENLALARAALDTVTKRVDAGKAAPTEKLKASVEVATGRMRVRRLGRVLVVARQRLAATWGSTKPRFTSVRGKLEDVVNLPKMDVLAPLLRQSPEIARWTQEIQQRQAALDLAKAKAVPDVTVGVGYKHMRDLGEYDEAMVASVSVPLPVFNRNQGEIRGARFSILKAKADQRGAEAEARAKLEKDYQELAAAYEDVVSLRDEVLPAAQSSFDASQKSFRAGKTGYLDVLDAQRTLTRIREQHVEALASYHQAVAAVEGLIGQSLDSVGGQKSDNIGN